MQTADLSLWLLYGNQKAANFGRAAAFFDVCFLNRVIISMMRTIVLIIDTTIPAIRIASSIVCTCVPFLHIFHFNLLLSDGSSQNVKFWRKVSRLPFLVVTQV